MVLIPYICMLAALLIPLLGPPAPARAAMLLPPAGYAFEVAPGCGGVRPHAQIYDACADQIAVLASASAHAKAGGQRLLIVFGATWCPSCKTLNRMLLRERILDAAGGLGGRLHIVEIAVSTLAHGRVVPVPSGQAALRAVLADMPELQLRAVPFLALVDPVSGLALARNLDDIESRGLGSPDPGKFTVLVKDLDRRLTTGERAPDEPSWLQRKWRRLMN